MINVFLYDLICWIRKEFLYEEDFNAKLEAQQKASEARQAEYKKQQEARQAELEKQRKEAQARRQATKDAIQAEKDYWKSLKK